MKKKRIGIVVVAAALALTLGMVAGCGSSNSRSAASGGANSPSSAAEASGAGEASDSKSADGEVFGYPDMTHLMTVDSSEGYASLSKYPHWRAKSGGYTTDIYASSEKVIDKLKSLKRFEADMADAIEPGEWVLRISVQNAGPDEYFTGADLFVEIPGNFQEKLDVCQRDLGLAVDSSDYPDMERASCHYAGGEEEYVSIEALNDKDDVVICQYIKADGKS